MNARRIVLCAGGALALSGLVLGLVRVVGHERGELEHRAGPVRLDELRRSDPHRTEQTVRLTALPLARGERVLVELCAASRAPASAWEGALHVVGWMPEREELLFRTPIGRALGERERGARRCWTVGIATVPRAGTLAIEAFWPGAAPAPEIARAALDVRVAAYTLPAALDRVAVALLALGALLALAGLARPAPNEPAGAPGGVGTAALALGLLALAQLASGLVSGGALGLVLSGLALAGAEVAIVAVLVRRAGAGRALDRLALHGAGRTGVVLALAAAALAGAVAVIVPGLWPARGIAPLEAAIAWPSGKLAVGLVALVVPAAEELFFRGLVFGALRPRLGTIGAVVGSTAVFLLAHVPQDLGNPGALVAVGVTGLLLGALRGVTGASWPCVVAHVLYDVVLVAVAWW